MPPKSTQQGGKPKASEEPPSPTANLAKQTVNVPNPLFPQGETKDVTQKTVVRGREYAECADGTSYTRRLGPSNTPLTPWVQVDRPESPPPNEPATKLVAAAQHQTPGAPKHWSLLLVPYIGDDIQEGGAMQMQVTGDAEHMHFESKVDVNFLKIETPAWWIVLSHYVHPEQFDVIRLAVNTEAPPWAESRAAVKENCQGWTVRVVKRLAEAGVVPFLAVSKLEELLEPV